ncbi:AfsR/SARP family transcriptional regulator [Streptomyces purpureus]|uniref:AfsR/SARP family transcriptional regulator n=1 Tax=Streptomyces purpureus TaxID=1951 RepID=UPI000367DC08|nr:BTAD domain-containing putative transcriptional regulator [Streptomyces purpureus]
MRFGVLGPLAVWTDDGGVAPVPERKVRGLLAELLIEPGRVVAADTLVEDLWSGRPPADPAGAVQTRVSRLRRALAAGGGRDLVAHRPPGYALLVAPERVDAGRFAALTARARALPAPAARAALLTEALGLWRGPAYADFRDEPFVREAVARLEEHRLTAVEDLAEARLDLGEHAPLAADLAEPVARHPLRERLRASHMRALYGAGRPSEALDSFHTLRHALAADLGLDPAPELTALYEEMLRHDRPSVPVGDQPGSRLRVALGGLTAPVPGSASGEATGVGPGSASGDVPALAARPAVGDAPGLGPGTASGDVPGPAFGGLSAPAAGLASGDVPALGDVPAMGSRPDGGDVPGFAPGPAPGDLPAHGDVPARAPRPTGGDATPPGPAGGNLPAPATPLIGRDAAVAEVTALLGEARLVTLTGAGGVGKTRLGLETAARAARGDFPDGTWIVELAGRGRAEEPGLECTVAEIAEVVASALGLRDDGPATHEPAGRLLAALRGRRLLLLLDNCEHVVEPAARLVELLLREAPGVRVLATSQEPLGLAGERLSVVEPLDDASARRLFAARAAAAAPGFEVNDANGPAVAAICRRLDGIPLALELAATRIRVLGAEQLAARLDDRFRLLTAGRRDAPARQQTLRAVIDWSWELLTAAERIVLRRLAVHAEGCTLAAAEAVCAGDGVKPAEVLDLLARLHPVTRPVRGRPLPEAGGQADRAVRRALGAGVRAIRTTSPARARHPARRGASRGRRPGWAPRGPRCL